VSAIVSQCDLCVLSGDDSLTLPMMSVGARGVISVASNVAPGPLVEMVQAALDGNWDKARQLHLRYYPLFRDMFIDANPIPVKAAMAMMGMIEERYRLPLCPMSDAKKAALRQTLKGLGLVKK
jgi:4-hydroxy-tetrahydrodipicolinate synthase